MGPVAVDIAIEQALGYLDGLPPTGAPPVAAADLGAGGGIPGLVLAALALPETAWALVERSRTRADWLDRAVRRLALGERVTVLWADAGTIARSRRRHAQQLVVARSLAPLPVLLEYAAPLLAHHGTVVATVSNAVPAPADVPPLGLALARDWATDRARYVAYRSNEVCPDRFPRRAAAIRRQPLF